MPETKNNFSTFPKRTSKVGFPLGKILAVFSLATGGLIDLTIVPLK